MDILRNALRQAKRQIEGNLTAEVIIGKVGDDLEAVVKVYRTKDGKRIVDHPPTGRPAKYPFRTMEIGDSFTLPFPVSGCYPRIHYWRSATGFNYKATKVSETETRIERVA